MACVRVFQGFLTVALLCLVSLIQPALAAIPTTLNYQGYLTDASGVALTGSHDGTFALYADAVGGAALWSETHGFTATNGFFQVELGSPLPIPGSLFDNPLYLGISIDADSEMSPRLRVSSLPSAYRAGCNPGDRIECYSGPAETVGIGVCQTGIRLCDAGGTGFGPCQNEVTPTPETPDFRDEDCDGTVDDGVCHILNCDPDCAHGTCSCENGPLSPCVVTCEPGFGNCNEDTISGADGCESNLLDVARETCGACGVTCADTDYCNAGTCEPDADNDQDGFTVGLGGDCDDDDPAVFPGALDLCDGTDNDCNGAVDDGGFCEDGNECTADLCGGVSGCDNSPSPAGTPCQEGTGICNGAGACELCGTDQVVCIGACTDIFSDVNNCGFCGNQCSAGECFEAVCSNGGCSETPSTAGTVCPSGGICDGAGNCMVCGPGQILCDAACTDIVSDINNCGDCGNQCPLADDCHVSACTGGSCSLTEKVNGSPCPGGTCNNGICEIN